MDKLERIQKLFDDGVAELESLEGGENPLDYAKMAIIDAYLHGLARGCMELLPKEDLNTLYSSASNFSSLYIDEDGYFMPIVNNTQFYTDGQD